MAICVNNEPNAEMQKLTHSTVANIFRNRMRVGTLGGVTPKTFGWGWGDRPHRPMESSPMVGCVLNDANRRIDALACSRDTSDI